MVRPPTRRRLVDVHDRRRRRRHGRGRPRWRRSSPASSDSIGPPAATTSRSTSPRCNRRSGGIASPASPQPSTAVDGSPPRGTAPAIAAGSTGVDPGRRAAPPVQPPGPARVVIVGDSQAHSLAINLPSASRARSRSPTARSRAAACTTTARCARRATASIARSPTAVAGPTSGAKAAGKARGRRSRSSCSARGMCSTSRSAGS